MDKTTEVGNSLHETRSNAMKTLDNDLHFFFFFYWNYNPL